MTMNRIFTFSILFLLSAAVTGCSSTNWMKKPDFSLLPPGPPAKAIAAWEPAIKHEAGLEKAQRGFGGRVYFYDQDGKKPVKVKGNVVVYAFDEEGREPDDAAPTRSYFFEEKDLKKLYSKSKLGHSYNFWVPWDSEGPDGKAKKISLIVRYVPNVGPSVVSSQVAAYLPGKAGQTELMAKKEWETRKENEGRIVQAGYFGEKKEFEQKRNGPPIRERLIESNSNRPVTMQTTTISMPHGFSQGMLAALGTSRPKVDSQENGSEILPVNYLRELEEERKSDPVKENGATEKRPEHKNARQSESRDFLNGHVQAYTNRPNPAN